MCLKDTYIMLYTYPFIFNKKYFTKIKLFRYKFYEKSEISSLSVFCIRFTRSHHSKVNPIKCCQISEQIWSKVDFQIRKFNLISEILSVSQISTEMVENSVNILLDNTLLPMDKVNYMNIIFSTIHYASYKL